VKGFLAFCCPEIAIPQGPEGLLCQVTWHIEKYFWHFRGLKKRFLKGYDILDA
jgi:hypothetical protein